MVEKRKGGKKKPKRPLKKNAKSDTSYEDDQKW